MTYALLPVSYWHCPHSMRSRVYVTVGCPSVRLSVCPSVFSIIRPQQRRATGLLLSARAGGGYRLSAANAGRPRRCSTVLSSKCGQCHVDSRVEEAEHRLVCNH